MNNSGTQTTFGTQHRVISPLKNV